MNKIYLLFIFLLAGCSKFDKVQSINECDFSAVKSHSDKYQYMYSCMREKGYLFTFDSHCFTSNALESCWEYSWRVFL